MKILVLGNSNLFQKKVYPGLKKIKNIDIEIASKRKVEKNFKIKKSYNSYNKAINKTTAKIVYISLINSMHFYWALKSLKKNKHVIIDKPFTINYDQTQKLIELASLKNLFLSEAIVFHKHKRFIKLFSKIDFKKPIRVISKFHIPRLNYKNFRNFNKYGGGCFNDMSAYASYLIYLLFKKNNYLITSKRKKDKKKVIDYFKIQAKSKDVKLDASFMFNSSYKNEMTIYNKYKKYSIDLVFSPPIDKLLHLKISKNNTKKIYKEYFKNQNIFYTYFKDIFKIIRQNKYNHFYKEIETIAKITKKIS